MNLAQKKILILSYYWPPAGGSGVQRWMYFAKYLKQLGYEPIIITVDETKASYPVIDSSLIIETNEIRVIKTSTREPLRWYSILISAHSFLKLSGLLNPPPPPLSVILIASTFSPLFNNSLGIT